MNNEIRSIARNLQQVLDGAPWYGRAVYQIMEEINPAKASIKPNQTGHSLLELLYHILTWADFTLKRIERDKEMDMAAFEKMDWRIIDPAKHSWEKGLKTLKSTHDKIISLLETKDDSFLDEKVDYREYDFRFLLNGLIQHDIYHLGQIAYIHKFLV